MMYRFKMATNYYLKEKERDIGYLFLYLFAETNSIE